MIFLVAFQNREQRQELETWARVMRGMLNREGGELMLVGQVMGTVDLKRSMSGAEELSWMQVKTEHNSLVALDPMGAKKGDWVLMVVGDGAWRSCENCPVDAAIVGIVENNGNSY